MPTVSGKLSVSYPRYQSRISWSVLAGINSSLAPVVNRLPVCGFYLENLFPSALATRQFLQPFIGDVSKPVV